MTMVDMPAFAPGLSRFGPGATFTIDSVSPVEQAGFVGAFCSDDGETETITHLCFATVGVTIGATVDVRLETIDSGTGFPTGTLAGTNTNGSCVIDNADDFTWKEVALTGNYTLTSGTILAVVIKGPSSGSVNLQILKGGAQAVYGQLSYCCEDVSGAGWAMTTYRPNVALKTSGGKYIVPLGAQCSKRFLTANFQTGSTPEQVGSHIVVAKSMRLIGVMMSYYEPDYDFYLKLISSDGVTVVTGDDGATAMSIFGDATYRSVATTQSLWFYQFPCPKTLTAETNYLLGWYPNEATNSAIYYQIWESAALKHYGLNIPQSGWTLSMATAKDPAQWSDWTIIDTQCACIFPVFDQIDIPAGGGGGSHQYIGFGG